MVVRVMAIAKVRYCETLLLETELLQASDWSKAILQDKLLVKNCFFLLNPDQDHDRPLDWA